MFVLLLGSFFLEALTTHAQHIRRKGCATTLQPVRRRGGERYQNWEIIAYIVHWVTLPCRHGTTYLGIWLEVGYGLHEQLRLWLGSSDIEVRDRISNVKMHFAVYRLPFVAMEEGGSNVWGICDILV